MRITSVDDVVFDEINFSFGETKFEMESGGIFDVPSANYPGGRKNTIVGRAVKNTTTMVAGSYPMLERSTQFVTAKGAQSNHYKYLVLTTKKAPLRKSQRGSA
jgi:hypothetical protein